MVPHQFAVTSALACLMTHDVMPGPASARRTVESGFVKGENVWTWRRPGRSERGLLDLVVAQPNQRSRP